MRLSVVLTAMSLSAKWVNSLVVPGPEARHHTLVSQPHIGTAGGGRSSSLFLSLPLSRATLVSLRESDTETKWIDFQKEELQQILYQIDALETDIQACDGSTDLIEAKQTAVTQLEKEANQLLSIVNPPDGLSMSDFQNAIKVFFNLPPQTRLALIKAVGMEDKVVTDPQTMLTLVAGLQPGNTARLKVRRGQEELEVKVLVGKRPKPQPEKQ